MQYLPLALISASLYGTYYFLIKAASKDIHQILGAVVLQVVAALTGVVLLGVLKFSGTHFTSTKHGFALACGAGIAVGLAEITSFILYSRGIQVTVGTPIIVGASIIVAGILGVLMLKESLQSSQFVGALLIIAGVIFITSTK